MREKSTSFSNLASPSFEALFFHETPAFAILKKRQVLVRSNTALHSLQLPSGDLVNKLICIPSVLFFIAEGSQCTCSFLRQPKRS